MDGRNTTSTLKLIPTAKDHDAELICSALNPAMTPSTNRNVSRSDNEGNNLAARIFSSSSSSSVETRRKLVVHCKMNERTHFRPFLFSFLVVSFSLVSSPTSNSLSLITNDTLLDEDEDVDNGDDEIFNNGIRRRRRRRSLLGNGEGILFFFQGGGIQENKSSIFPSPFIRKRERRNPIPQHQRREKEQDAHFYFLFRVVWRLCVSSCLLTGWNISGHSGMNDIRAALQNGARKIFRPEIEGKSQLTDNRRANSDTVINFFLFFY
jgi:hypothetical protein